MARTPRKNMKDSSFFHIMVQGINKEYIFNTKINKEKYYNLLYKNNERIDIIAYCIMSNHAHILIHTNDIAYVENWMKKVNISYARYYNYKNDRIGYVFRDRYKVQIIKNYKHLYLCSLYIHNNPVEAGLCNTMEEYEFSSFSNIYNANQLKIYSKIDKLLQNENYEHTLTNIKETEDKFELVEDSPINKRDICNNIVNEFLENRNLRLEDLKTQKESLIELVKILREDNNISYRIMERYLKISREKLRNIQRLQISKEVKNDKFRK